ncbi:MAG: SGNH/GDSL hydrolase family protein [Byssovorax sp.]
MIALTALIASSLGASRTSADEPAYVIGPEQGPVLTAMLGGADPLPGGCKLASASIDQGRALARYHCDGGAEPVLELHHPGAPGVSPRLETAQFALIVPPSPPMPQALLDAVAARLRAGEAAFVWTHPDWASRRDGGSDELNGPPPAARAPSPPPSTPFVRYLGWALLPILAWHRRRSARRPASRLTRGMAAVGVGLAAYSILAGALRSTGRAVVGAVFRAPGTFTLALCVALASAVALSFLVRLSLAAARGAVPVTLALASFLGAAVASFADDVTELDAEPSRFGKILSYPAHTTVADGSIHRRTILVPINSRGFRGPDFADHPAPGTERVVLVGDSFVFGSGVEWEDTLGEQLRRVLAEKAPGRRFEVLNLGIPGDNLPSHVEVYDEAVRSLDPAVVLIGLTFPNDLSAYDDQPMRRTEVHTSSYQVVQWALGPAFARLAWGAGKIAIGYDAEALAVLDHETARLRAMRASPNAPPLLFFSYFGGPPAIRTALETVPGAQVVQNPPHDLRYWIPEDWHPTPAGNRAFAGSIADAILALPARPAQ